MCKHLCSEGFKYYNPDYNIAVCVTVNARITHITLMYARQGRKMSVDDRNFRNDSLMSFPQI